MSDIERAVKPGAVQTALVVNVRISAEVVARPGYGAGRKVEGRIGLRCLHNHQRKCRNGPLFLRLKHAAVR